MPNAALYDRIGGGYSALRQSDPRIAQAIHAALGDAETVINVGAGAGSYEPRDRLVTAVEPSAEMIAQRPPDAPPAINASAEALPFPDTSFDAAMAVLTVHHWCDQRQGLHELRRVARGPVVVLTFEQNHPGTWLGDYLPGLRELDARQAIPFDVYRECLGEIDILPVPVPHDCIDGFLYAYWRRPRAYLDPAIRAGSSSFHVLENIDSGLQRLANELENGDWERKYGHIRELAEFDAGYRLIVS